ncbi:hypothetical protein CJ030_MR2G003993 [Morella rubra]|uniref:Uncharacterized protein n=1 Tax=Morella rubra TaxID=262757 RepID=A0A6A1WD56_9ROSI|nr:hypothetical protein CJ030_MR2G003993 [Morella rubra]
MNTKQYVIFQRNRLALVIIEIPSLAISARSSQDFDHSLRHHQACDMFKDVPATEVPDVPKKPKRKKSRSTSSPKTSSSRSGRASKSKTGSSDMDATISNLRG